MKSGVARASVVVVEGRGQAAGRQQGGSDQGRARRGRQPRGRARMNPSRPFILRPVATSLLMVGDPAGRASWPIKQLPVSALPQVDYPTIQVLTFYPGRQPGRHGLVGHRAAGAAVRPGAGPEPDDLDQLRRQLGHHAAVRPGPEHRRGRAGGAGGDQRGRHLPARRTCRSRRSTARSIRPTRRS